MTKQTVSSKSGAVNVLAQETHPIGMLNQEESHGRNYSCTPPAEKARLGVPYRNFFACLSDNG
jgi:hypothetical protein